MQGRLAAEAAGTAFLVMAVIGSGAMAAQLTDDPALMLLANAAATAAALFVLITALAPLSGAHLNPAVTLALALRREMPGRIALAYAAAQLGGAVAGAILAHAMFELPLVASYATPRTGVGQWLSELVAAFGLVATILLVRAARAPALAAAVALFIFAAYWFTASTAFANPAATIARALSSGFAGIRWADVLPFIAAQLMGAGAASLLLGPSGAEPTGVDPSRSVRGGEGAQVQP